MLDIHAVLPLYLIAGSQDCPNGQLLPLLETALQAGITCFQFREKGPGSCTSSGEKRKLAQACQQLCRNYQVPLIVNDDLELALAIDADGIHVGQTDCQIEQVIALASHKLIGLSCYDHAEIRRANQFPEISYYGIGPVFATRSKVDAKPAIGLASLAQLTELASKPAVAIGGITLAQVPEILQAGAAGVAVISAITQACDVATTVRKFRHHL